MQSACSADTPWFLSFPTSGTSGRWTSCIAPPGFAACVSRRCTLFSLRSRIGPSANGTPIARHHGRPAALGLRSYRSQVHAPSFPALATAVPILSAEHNAFAKVFRAAHAISPAAALPLDAMPGIDPRAVLALATRGDVREAEPGRYYLSTDTEHQRWQRLLTGFLTGAGIVAVTVGFPLVVWLLTS